MRALLFGGVALALGACGYEPPAQTDTAAPRYTTDLAACEKNASADVGKQNSKRALTWFASPVRRWGQIGDATQDCMAGKGYGRLRWCTADELKQARSQGTTVVTASGVQCTDPPAVGRARPG